MTKPTSFPQGKIGDLNISHLILGGNLIAGIAHGRDFIYVSKLFRAYNSDERIYETLRFAENRGINTIILPIGMMHYINKYNHDMDGNIQSIAQVYPRKGQRLSEINANIHYAMEPISSVWACLIFKSRKM